VPPAYNTFNARRSFERLLEKPGLYQDEMAVYLFDKFNVLVNTSAISRALASVSWTKKAARQVAKERSADLRDFYLYNLPFGRTTSSMWMSPGATNELASDVLAGLLV